MEASKRERSYDELLAACEKLESEAGQQLIMQRDLIRAKDQIDEELMRFKAIQTFIASTLGAETEAEFFSLTLEAIIEAFEYEVAILLRPCEEPVCLAVSSQFGFDEIGETLPYLPKWFSDSESQIVGRDSAVLEAWADLRMEQAIVCPIFDKSDLFAGALVTGITQENSGFYEEITEQDISAFTVMVRQAGALWTNRQLNGEILTKNQRLEAEAGHQLIMQRDLIKAKDRTDEELMRFKAIQTYIAGALDQESEDDFLALTLEAMIEAFEFEVALFLRRPGTEGRLTIASEFGFDGTPEDLPYSDDWFASRESQIVGSESPVLDAWAALRLDHAIICPFYDKNDEFAGAILGGITEESADFYEAISEAQNAAYTVMVRQAGALSINRQLNNEIRRHNERLLSLTESYSRFVPFEFLELLSRTSIEEIDAGDHASLDMGVLVLDIRGFTAMTKQLGPADAFIWLNEFLEIMEPLIAKENGFINQYQGDAIMALFPGAADAAIRCAMTMISESDSYNARQEKERNPPVRFGLGINSGQLMLGAIGGANRLDSNVVGDTANLASRTEGLTKHYGARVIFTEFTRDRLQAPDDFTFRELDRVTVKGRDGAVTIFELLNDGGGATVDGREKARQHFETGLSQYRAGDFPTARESFTACLEQTPEDAPAALFVRRCDEFLAHPPAAPWDGVSSIDEK